MDPELRPAYTYKRIVPLSLELEALTDKTFRKYWEEIACICLEKYNQDKVTCVFLFLFVGLFNLSVHTSRYMYVKSESFTRLICDCLFVVQGV